MLTPAKGTTGRPARRIGRPPRQADATVTRERILAAAIALFAERGFAGATVREIGAAAGITDGAVYRHFPSKDAILEAVLAEFERRVYQPVPAPAGATAGFIHGLLAGLPRVILADPVLLDCSRFLLGEAQRNPRIREFVVSRFVDQAETFTAALIREARPGPDGQDLPAELLAKLINSLRFGWVFGSLIIKPPGDLPALEAELSAIAGFLDRAIAPPGRGTSGTEKPD